GERFVLAEAAPAAEPAVLAEDAAAPADGLEVLSDLPLPKPVPLPERPPPPQPPALAEAQPPPAETPAARARRVFQERLAYSPRRDEARHLLDEIARAEHDGRTADVDDLTARIERL